MIRVGVLALQGSVIEHLSILKKIPQVQPVLVKTKSDLDSVDGIILPGGESTTIGKLLTIFDLMEPLRRAILAGLPVYGTCAGMILLAKEIVDESAYLNVMDITVRRNAYGRQIDSFKTKALLPLVSSNPLELVFIRAPWIEKVGPSVDVLLSLQGHIVAARQKNMLVTSFHPELTKQTEIHHYFVNMIKENNAL
jgi:5'-phosphate synthase pdxT subunit